MTVETVRPISAVSAVWNVSTVGNIDDAVSQPTAGDGLRIQKKGSAVQAQQYNMRNPTNSGTMTEAKVWILGRIPDLDFIAKITLIRISLNGTWYSSGAMALEMADSYTWYGTTISVSGEINGCAPIVELTGQGFDGSNSQLDVDVLYADLTYTAAAVATTNPAAMLALL